MTRVCGATTRSSDTGGGGLPADVPQFSTTPARQQNPGPPMASSSSQAAGRAILKRERYERNQSSKHEIYVNCGNCRSEVWSHERCICVICGREFCVNCTPSPSDLLTFDAAQALEELMFELRSCFQCVHRAALSRITLKG